MTVNPTGNRFCGNCGTQLELACAQCGRDLVQGARYCGHCGCPVASPAVRAAAEQAPQWGELKQATVLFADVVGSTELIAGMDPEEAMGHLRPAVLRMRHSVERFGGTVVRTLGDGVMALFGVPRTLEGHALLACQAALHMQQVFGQDPRGLSIRVGLHSGEVASDPQDAHDGQGGGAHGLTIHVASRVVALAEPGAICLTEATRVLAGSSCQTDPQGSHFLKGIREAVPLHTLSAITVSGLNMGSRGVRTATFRGRERELAQVAQALDAIEAGTSRVLGIVGEPGAGKSRLCHEFAVMCRGRAIPVYEVRAQLYGHALPLAPILELFRTYFFSVAAGDDAARVRERIAARFAPLDVAAEDLDLLFDFFGVAAAGAAPSQAGPRARQSRLLGLLKDLVRHEPGQRRLILIEDLHWLDEASEEFISALVDAVAGTRTLLLLNYRGSYHCPWLRVPHFEQIELGELPADEMDAMVAELMAPVSDSPEVCALVCRRSGGNPFFAEELVRTLAESNILAAGAGLPAGGLAEVERALPATVRAVIGARLDRLGEPEKTVLQMCAIIGKDIPLSVLEHVASPIASEIERGLDGLYRSGLILPQPALTGRRFAFRHPLIQEVAYSSQLKVRRGHIHSRVAAAMEIYCADQLDEFAGLIAYHYEEAGQHVPAARYNARAAAWVGSTNPAQAIRHWHKVHTLLAGLPRTTEISKLRALAAGRIVYLGWREGMSLDDVGALISEALELASDADPRLPQLLVFAQGRMLQGSGGSADSYVESVRRAMQMGSGQDDPGRSATLHLALSHACAWAGLLDEGLAANDVAMRDLHRIDRFDREFIGFSLEDWALAIRVRLLNRMGRFDDAIAALAGMPQAALASEDPVLRQIAHHIHVDLAWCKRDPEIARQHAEAVAQIAQQYPNPYSSVFAPFCTGLAELTEGQHEKARKTLAEALRIIHRTRVAVDFETEILAAMAECSMELREWDQARQEAQESVRLSRLRSNRFSECRAMIVLGELQACAEQAAGDDAQHLDEAERLIRFTGAHTLVPHLQRARAAGTQQARS
ncbi:MAG: AAA family ATPase [Ramlibacter sp.]